MEACCLSYAKVHWHAIIGVLSVKDPKLWMVKCSIGHERKEVRGMGSLIDLKGPMIPMTIINITKEDISVRDGHKEHRYSTKDERMKDQARCGHGRSSRRDDDDDRHIREQEGRKIKDDGYRDENGYRTRQSEKGASREGASSRQQFTIFANKILPLDKQQSVPGRDTGES